MDIISIIINELVEKLKSTTKGWKITGLYNHNQSSLPYLLFSKHELFPRWKLLDTIEIKTHKKLSTYFMFWFKQDEIAIDCFRGNGWKQNQISPHRYHSLHSFKSFPIDYNEFAVVEAHQILLMVRKKRKKRKERINYLFNLNERYCIDDMLRYIIETQKFLINQKVLEPNQNKRGYMKNNDTLYLSEQDAEAFYIRTNLLVSCRSHNDK